MPVTLIELSGASLLQHQQMCLISRARTLFPVSDVHVT